MFLFNQRWVLLSPFALILAACAPGGGSSGENCVVGPETIVDFTAMPTDIHPSIIIPDGIVTGSADLYTLNSNGLGVMGGSDSAIDGVESVTFSFTAPAVNVSYYVNAAGNGDGDSLVGEAFVEPFDEMGISLGTSAVFSIGIKDVSALNPDTPILSFMVTADVDSHRIYSLTYSLLDCQP